MLKFTTFHTKDGHLTPDSKPHITPPADSRLVGDEVVGRNALIVGKALELAGYDIPMFFAGNIAELDSPAPANHHASTFRHLPHCCDHGRKQQLSAGFEVILTLHIKLTRFGVNFAF